MPLDRLPGEALSPDSPEHTHLLEIVASSPWEVSLSFRFSQSAHINLLEIRA